MARRVALLLLLLFLSATGQLLNTDSGNSGCQATPLQTQQVFNANAAGILFKGAASSATIGSVTLCMGVSSGSVSTGLTFALRGTDTASKLPPVA